jgi:hypothetical protein
MQAQVKIEIKGPVFNGQAKAATRSFLVEATDKIAQEGYDDVKQTLGQVLRHPTGHYESRIQTSRASSGSVVHDSGVIYGGWLEGTSSRNRSTRFKGYATFRKVTQRLQSKAGPIAETVLRKYLGRMQ